MPQTLLSILALVGAAFFTIGQKEGSANTLESIVADEFEVAVAGALIQTMEYADSRAFDEATTPQSLRARLGLPGVLTQVALDTLTIEDVAVPTGSFAAPSQFGIGLGGAVVRCDSRDQRTSINCNDVSDLHDRAANTWHDVTLTTPNGDPLPVEVHVEVNYVEATAPDVIVNRRTNHKRVDVWARSPVLMRTKPNHTVYMRRVISFDPAVALEYLKRTTCVVGPEYAAQVAAAQAQVLAAQAAADVARQRATATLAAIETARQTAALRTSELTLAQGRVTTAQQNLQIATQNAQNQAQQNVQAAQAAYTAAQNAAQQALQARQTALTNLNNAKAYTAQVERDVQNASGWAWVVLYYVTLPNARSAEAAAQTAYNDANAAYQAKQQAVTAAQQALTAAQQATAAQQQAVTAAQQALTAAQQAAAQAQTAATAATLAIATAEAAAATAAQTVAAADRSLEEAKAALAALSGCRRA